MVRSLALRTHVRRSTTPRPGPRPCRAGRSRLKPRRAQRYRWRLKFLPVLRMSGASARYSRTYVPVETSTPPSSPRQGARRAKAARKQTPGRAKMAPREMVRILQIYDFFGSGYSTPKVSTVTFFITCGVLGLSFQVLRGVWAMAAATSKPLVSLPKAA